MTENVFQNVAYKYVGHIVKTTIQPYSARVFTDFIELWSSCISCLKLKITTSLKIAVCHMIIHVHEQNKQK